MYTRAELLVLDNAPHMQQHKSAQVLNCSRGERIMTLVGFRNNLLLLVICLYLLLDYGFMQVRLTTGSSSGIPIGELVLLFSLLTINYSSLLPRLSQTIILVPFVVWWAFGISRAVLATSSFGFWALRDANHVIESLFLVAGFSFAALPEQLERFFRWLRNILALICIYAIGYPLRETLQSFSPKLISGAGVEVPLFFTYINTSSLLILSSSYLLLISYAKKFYNIVLAVLLLGFSIFTFQGRTIYLQICAVFIAASFYRKEFMVKGMISILLLLGLIATIPVIGVNFRGRLGQEVSLHFLMNHFLTIAGVESEGLEGAAGGVPQRLEWWRNLYERWTSDVTTFLFGLGYGFPLVDFEDHQGITVREPHNSYISIMSRLGLLGIITFLWIHILLIKAWHNTYRACQRMNWQEAQKRLLILMIFFILVWVYAIGEDALEKPFVTIPYYFFWGIVLRVNWHLKYNCSAYARSLGTQEYVPVEQPNDRVKRVKSCIVHGRYENDYYHRDPYTERDQILTRVP
jgi:hypothetical protein